MLKKVVLTHGFIPEVVDTLKGRLSMVRVEGREELLREVQDAQGLLVELTTQVDEEVLTAGSELKVVSTMSVGVDHIDLAACKKRGIKIVNTPGVLTQATAETTLCLLLALAKRMPEGEALCRLNKFQGWEPDFMMGLQLKGRLAVVVGAGRIGRRVARMFRAMGMNVDFITREDRAADIKAKLSQAQVLSLHLPYSKKTHHWLNHARLSLLPKDAMVINTARGPIIEEAALIRALRNNRIFGAGLDVFEHEPHIPEELRELTNVVLLPHLGSATLETRTAMCEKAVRGLVRWLRV